MITSISRKSTFGVNEIFKKILFKYDPNIMEMFTNIEVTQDIIAQNRGTFEATELYRYEVKHIKG